MHACMGSFPARCMHYFACHLIHACMILGACLLHVHAWGAMAV